VKRKPEYEPGVITAQLLSSLYINNKIFRQANTGSHRFALVQFAPILKPGQKVKKIYFTIIYNVLQFSSYCFLY
jgi:hypothetical protein